jgi:hypothetical protein
MPSRLDRDSDQVAHNSSADGRAGIQLFAKSVLNYFLLTYVFNVEYQTPKAPDQD